MGKTYQYFPPTGALPGKSFELQTVEFFEGLQFDVDKNATNIAALQLEQTALTSSISTQIEGLRQELADTAAELEQYVGNAVQSLERRIDGMGTIITTLADRLLTVEQQQTRIAETVASQAAQITALNTTVGQHTEVLAAQAVQITSISGTATQALTTAQQGLMYTLRGTCSGTGNWTIAGCVVGRPLYIVTASASPPADDITASSGAWGSGPVQQFVPTATTVVLNVQKLAPGTTLRAYQPGA